MNSKCHNLFFILLMSPFQFPGINLYYFYMIINNIFIFPILFVFVYIFNYFSSSLLLPSSISVSSSHLSISTLSQSISIQCTLPLSTHPLYIALNFSQGLGLSCSPTYLPLRFLSLLPPSLLSSCMAFLYALIWCKTGSKFWWVCQLMK